MEETAFSDHAVDVMNENLDTLTRLADSMHELRWAPGQFAAENPRHIAASTPEHRAATGKRQNRSGDTRHDRLVNQLEVPLRALKVDGDRRRKCCCHDHRRRRTPSRCRRSKSRENCMCYYHTTFGPRARKCRPPYSWNAGNKNSRP
jgi:hypothetical protein